MTTQTDETLDGILAEIRSTFAADFEPLQVDDGTLQVLGIHDMQRHIDKLIQTKTIRDPLKDLPLWAKIWPGSIVLGRMLRKFAPEGKTLLELGGGCGILAMIAARYGFARIVTSDINRDALRFAQANILRNNLQDRVSVRYLDVADSEETKLAPNTFDMIAASEILYLDDLHRPIVKFLERHLTPGGKALFCTDMARLKPHFAKMAAKTYSVTEGHIGVKGTDDAGREERRVYSILILEKKHV
ncbi:MAG: 50S ribosomal protein L11 methyltransferase [Desulfovibrio sp.]|nr:50S ribosomal protein L11 methyltransferase [Desulfovibrio sp.]